MHPVENAKRLAKVHQDKPGGEAKELLPEAVLKLRVDSEGWDDPELREERRAAVSAGRLQGRKEGRTCAVTGPHHDVGQDEEGTDLFIGSFSPGPFPIMHLGNW